MRCCKLIPVIALAVLLSPLASATLTPNEAVYAGEDSVYEIYNDLYGTAYGSNVGLDVMRIVDLQTFSIPDGEMLRVEAEVRYASIVSEFGWYTPIGAPTTYNPLFTVTEVGDVSGMYIDHIVFGDDFGFYLDTGGANTIWHSEQALNPLLEDHMVAYAVEADPNVVLLAWEDLPYRGSDMDFNDLVVELRFTVIPEPTSMLLLGLGIAGMVVRRIRTVV